MNGVILWSILVTSVIATDGNKELRDLGPENKGPLLFTYDIAVLGTILAIKFKAFLIVIAFIIGAALYYKVIPGLGNKGFKCEPPLLYDSKHKYNYDMGPPFGHSERSDRASDLTEQSEILDFELMATIMRGIGLRDLTFNVTDQDPTPCKRRIVCEADRLATKYPVVGYATNILRSLSRYRTSRSATHRRYSCAELHPHCNSRGSQQNLQKNQKTSTINLQNSRK